MDKACEAKIKRSERRVEAFKNSKEIAEKSFGICKVELGNVNEENKNLQYSLAISRIVENAATKGLYLNGKLIPVTLDKQILTDIDKAFDGKSQEQKIEYIKQNIQNFCVLGTKKSDLSSKAVSAPNVGVYKYLKALEIKDLNISEVCGELKDVVQQQSSQKIGLQDNQYQYLCEKQYGIDECVVSVAGNIEGNLEHNS